MAQGQAAVSHPVRRREAPGPASLGEPRAKRRGGQPGNTNNLKHGLYAELISVRDDVELSPMDRDQSDAELALSHVRLKELILKQRNAPPQDWLSYEKAIQHYLDRISSITHKNAVLGRQHGIAFTTVMEMIRQANDEQDVL